MNFRRSILLLALAAVSLAGCKTAYVKDPLTLKLGGNDVDSQMEFWHELQDRPVTSNDEAFHGLLLYTNGEDPSSNYVERVKYLKSKNILPPDFNRPADEAVSRGILAVAIVRSLDIKGGMMLHALPYSTRYATRELQYVGIYPASSPQQTFSGAAFLGIMGRVEDWQRGNPADKPAEYLPEEPATRPVVE